MLAGSESREGGVHVVMPATAPDQLTLVPQHVAIIMDGNGRWARERGLPRLAGHRAGTENTRQIIESCVEFGVQILTLYAFSTENWQRPRDEVDGLLSILGNVIDRETQALVRAYYTITDRKVRKRVFEMAKALANFSEAH